MANKKHEYIQLFTSLRLVMSQYYSCGLVAIRS